MSAEHGEYRVPRFFLNGDGMGLLEDHHSSVQGQRGGDPSLRKGTETRKCTKGTKGTYTHVSPYCGRFH